jgi:hypothetical protein
MPLSTERNTPERVPDFIAVPMAANVRAFKGGLAVLAAGNAQPGATALNLVAAGRFEETVDNLGGAAGAKSVNIRRGCFQFRNSGVDPVLAADINKDCFVVDDEFVARTNGTNTRSVAGKVKGVDAAGVWVEIL